MRVLAWDDKLPLDGHGHGHSRDV